MGINGKDNGDGIDMSYLTGLFPELKEGIDASTSEEVDDRREHTRASAEQLLGITNNIILVHTENISNRKILNGNILDISKGGMLLKTNNDKHQLFDTINLSFRIGTRSFKINGQVLRIEKTKSGKTLYGIKFLEPNEKKEKERFLENVNALSSIVGSARLNNMKEKFDKKI
ncbi:hypothetical protein EOM39_02005 [Candidatus Gracilibacteria bacterium]|nr:hypothetical protein [Candidatus Gracilibacteria bacterium]